MKTTQSASIAHIFVPSVPFDSSVLWYETALHLKPCSDEFTDGELMDPDASSIFKHFLTRVQQLTLAAVTRPYTKAIQQAKYSLEPCYSCWFPYRDRNTSRQLAGRLPVTHLQGRTCSLRASDSLSSSGSHWSVPEAVLLSFSVY